MPSFRRQTYITAFGEGWGLYSEFLGLDMGFYEDPYEDFGRLSYEMWRACRLVVDTGIHYFGWTREEAESCFLDNSALSPLNVTNEVARYISMPGQALAYKTGGNPDPPPAQPGRGPPRRGFRPRRFPRHDP